MSFPRSHPLADVGSSGTLHRFHRLTFHPGRVHRRSRRAKETNGAVSGSNLVPRIAASFQVRRCESAVGIPAQITPSSSSTRSRSSQVGTSTPERPAPLVAGASLDAPPRRTGQLAAPAAYAVDGATLASFSSIRSMCHANVRPLSLVTSMSAT